MKNIKFQVLLVAVFILSICTALGEAQPILIRGIENAPATKCTQGLEGDHCTYARCPIDANTIVGGSCKCKKGVGSVVYQGIFLLHEPGDFAFICECSAPGKLTDDPVKAVANAFCTGSIAGP